MSSSAPSSSPPSAKPEFDLSYSIDDVVLDPHRDGQYLYKRLDDVMPREGAAGGRTLDVACGVGNVANAIARRGTATWGLEPSLEMIGIGRYVHHKSPVAYLRGVAETLPFRDGSFDRVVCQGSLDHFVDPHAFMREAARVLRPDGRVVIALANYESLSCRLGRRLARGLPVPERPYYQPPPDHYHKGDLPFVRALGATLRLERCYGVSMLWGLQRGGWAWGKWLDWRPRWFANGLLRALDGLAYRLPSQADMIVSVWRTR
jgi:SAM-dependent methyltransferase